MYSAQGNYICNEKNTIEHFTNPANPDRSTTTKLQNIRAQQDHDRNLFSTIPFMNYCHASERDDGVNCWNNTTVMTHLHQRQYCGENRYLFAGLCYKNKWW
jgi:hypothetical protein